MNTTAQDGSIILITTINNVEYDDFINISDSNVQTEINNSITNDSTLNQIFYSRNIKYYFFNNTR